MATTPQGLTQEQLQALLANAQQYGTEVHVLDNYVLSATQFIKFNDGAYIVLEEGDQVRATSETGSTMNTINTFELYRKGE